MSSKKGKKQDESRVKEGTSDKSIHDSASNDSANSKAGVKSKVDYESRVKELEAQVLDLTNTLKRVQADFENYRKRVESQRAESVKFASQAVIKKLLPIIDDFELALNQVGDSSDPFVKGVEMIYASLLDLLEQEGVSVINPLGLPFDPFRHEALLTRHSDQPANTVVEVMQKGYALFDRVLRPARVVVSKGPSKGSNGEKDSGADSGKGSVEDSGKESVVEESKDSGDVKKD